MLYARFPSCLNEICLVCRDACDKNILADWQAALAFSVADLLASGLFLFSPGGQKKGRISLTAGNQAVEW